MFYFHRCLIIRFQYILAFFLSVTASSEAHSDMFTEHDQLFQYFQNYTEETSPDEMIDFLLNIKDQLSHQGLEIPRLSMIFIKLKESLICYGISLPDENWNEFLQVLDQKETGFSLAGLKKIGSKHKESWKLIWGGCQLLAGALCYLIPHPGAHVAGGILIAGGLTCVGEEIGRLDAENKKEQELKGPPHLPPHFPREYFVEKSYYYNRNSRNSTYQDPILLI